MRRDIEFNADGVTLRGWLYLPAGASGPVPAVVMSHGYSAVKEMTLDRYAEVFCAAGLAVVVYDNRCLGASDGEPRQDIDPFAQRRDYRFAISFAQAQPEIDAERIGIWGTSYTGGSVLAVAAVDRRVKCVVSQVPLVIGARSLQQLLPLGEIPAFHRMLDEDRARRMAGEPLQYVQICAPGPEGPAVFPGTGTWRYFQKYVEELGDCTWENRCTVRSLEYMLEYDVSGCVSRISPTPLMMIVSEFDTVTPTDVAIEVFDQARDPKRLVVVPNDHYAAYLDGFEYTSAVARDWFLEHL